MWYNFEPTHRWRCMVNTKTGDIIAYENYAQHRKIETNVNAFINQFPCEDRDFIILWARDILYRKCGVMRTSLPSYVGTI